ncbi:hypothetical protein C8J57DRAFT_1090226, partial [Mycena rebaudengoi]
MYASSQFHIADLYVVGVNKSVPRATSMPFVCYIEAEGPRGELIRIRSLVDNGAMVCAMCTTMYEAVKHRLGKLKRSGKMLRMANGVLVPSRGYWEGNVRFGGATVWAVFKVFPSGGSWSFLFGKPLLEAFEAMHNYTMDVIVVPGPNGAMIIAN